MEQKIDHTGGEITGKLAKKGENIHASVLYREAMRRLTVKRGDKVLKKENEPIIFYATLLQKPGQGDHICTCPNCGHKGLVSVMRDGCPYCGSVFEINDVWPVFSSWYSVPGIAERSSLMPRLKKIITILFIAASAVSALITWFSNPQDTAGENLLVSLVTGVFMGGAAAFFGYMLFSFGLLGKVFSAAGRSMPLLRGLKTKDSLESLMKGLEPDFSYPLFEGRMVSLLRAIAYTDDRSSLSIYEGDEDLSFLDSLIDMQYRGVLQLLSHQISGGVIRLKLKAFMDDLHYDGKVRRRDEEYIICTEKDISAQTDPGFSLCSVSCKSCGASFDALHMRCCPYCSSPYLLVHDDWMITSIQKA